EVVETLRSPGGCPWDLAQNPQSLTPYILEEAHELVEALETGSRESQVEELGDLLFQVLLQSVIASQARNSEQSFDLEEVMQKLQKKLVERHPHVFGSEKFRDAEEVWKNWHAQKQKKSEGISLPPHLPALLASHKIGVKSSGYQFDWERPEEVLAKVEEELSELKYEMRKRPQSRNPELLKEEIGDLLFSIAQLARHLQLEAETCARSANRKFVDRFQRSLQLARSEKKDWKTLKASEKDAYWQRAKQDIRREASRNEKVSLNSPKENSTSPEPSSAPASKPKQSTPARRKLKKRDPQAPGPAKKARP
ncbi:MAG: nucleoside triphosphate pyrophosphohydrolase, partial [Bdellovibrio sp.]